MGEQPKFVEAVRWHFAKGVVAKEMRLPAGHIAKSHKHKFDHLSFLHRGIATVETEGAKTTHSAGDMVMIRAGFEHEIVALTDTVWFCINANPDDETDPAAVDLDLIRVEA